MSERIFGMKYDVKTNLRARNRRSWEFYPSKVEIKQRPQ